MKPLLSLLLMVLFAGHLIAQTSNHSLYTSVDAKHCRTIKSTAEEAGSYEGRCRGVAGYNLMVEEGDLRTNIKVIAPGGATHSLDLWSIVSPAFSSPGPRVEWRMTKRNGRSTPVALIIRYNASENPDNPNKITSFLAVAKITTKEICVTDKIVPGPRSNEEARRTADTAQTRPCLKQ